MSGAEGRSRAAVLREPSEEYPRLAEEEFYPRVFSREHAQVIDRALYWLHTGQIPEPRRSLLALLLTKWILRLQPMSMLRGTDARAAIGGDYDRVSPRRAGHYLRSRRLLAPAGWWELARQVNLGVFAGDGEAHQREVFDFLGDVEGDVVYLDPPYPRTTPYEKEYGVLDRLLEGRTYEPSRSGSANRQQTVAAADASSPSTAAAWPLATITAITYPSGLADKPLSVS